VNDADLRRGITDPKRYEADKDRIVRMHHENLPR